MDFRVPMDLVKRHWARAGLLLVAWQLLVPRPATAQLLSPGKLARAHAELEGISNCTRCHDVGKKVDGRLCLECHIAIQRAIAGGRGLHARQAAAGKNCLDCHREHRGENASLVDWGGARERFDHKRTGYPLVDKHAALKCEQCHQARRVADAELRKSFAGNRRGTHLGLTTRCTACHFDEHRGQLGADCDRCHDPKGFKPAPRFRHAEKFALTGGHAQVECSKCHGRESTAAADAAAFPAPVDASGFVRYRLPQARRCVDCHRDLHAGKFGRSCERCHSTASWTETRAAKVSPSFHDRSRFPLIGKHRSVACASCHPAKRTGKGMQTKGFAFARCTDCHRDAHFGQLAKVDGAVPCQRCHSEAGFFPTRYPLADHQQSRYPLQGAHAAVACNGCHKPDPERFAAQLPAAQRRGAASDKRTELYNLTRLKFPELDLQACDSCHRDPHRGQFSRGAPVKACQVCHVVESFRRLDFDHDRDSSFKLDGKHTPVGCAGCHRVVDGAVLYRGAPTRCNDCHADVHAGQFDVVTQTSAAIAGGCQRCHDTAGFKPTRFSHDDPQASFALRGKHRPLACNRCHPRLSVAGGAAVSWYRGVPLQCAGCHVDAHAGSLGSECSRCHSESGWHDVAFDHEQTHFPLRGRHAEADCRGCHGQLQQLALDPRCQSCHVDRHTGRLGQQCERCHDQSSWRSGAGVQAHGQTRFPLYGRHAMVPCEQCHQARADLTFGGAPISCAACHASELQRTVGTPRDHSGFGLAPDCRRCHETVAWRRALLPDHERCFPLAVGRHRNIACLDCHSALSGLAVTSCASFSAACTRCHGCSSMDEEHSGEHRVAGYQCADRKCYECHPTGGGD